MAQPDPKPRKRVTNPKATKLKLQADRKCRSCEQPATDGHHVLLRSQGGDDVPDNIMPLCHACHMAWHAGNISTLRIRTSELYYVFSRLGKVAGADYVKRRRYEAPA